MTSSTSSNPAPRLHYTPKLYECSCCHELKPESEYYKQAYTGLRSNQCMTCVKVKKSVVRHKAKHGKFISKERIRGMEEPNFSLEDWKDSMVHFKGCCAFCGKPEGRAKADKMDRDHLVALARGGKTVRNNIVPACRKCNRGRGSKDWREWFRAQPFWSAAQEKRIQGWVDQLGYK